MKQTKKTLSLGMIGAGKMATAIASGIAKNMPELNVTAYDVSPKAAEQFTAVTGFKTGSTLKAVLSKADIVLLAVKPQYAADALKEAAPLLKGKLLISIVAGWTIEALCKASGIDRVIRVMPNTPALAGAGMSCFAPAAAVSGQDSALAEKILGSFGRVVRVPEKQMDAVTGLSGSGPAYVMEFIMGLADGGVYCGLPRAVATELAIQTVLGTAVMCQAHPEKIAELRDAVISPAGTTARGILALQENGFKAASAKAVIAAAEFSEKLGKTK